MNESGFAFTALLSMFNTIFDGRVVAKLPFTPIYWIQVSNALKLIDFPSEKNKSSCLCTGALKIQRLFRD